MCDPEKKDEVDHWKSLVEQVGAEPDESAFAPPPEQETPPSEPPPVPRESRPKRSTSPRVASDWDQLAGELGVEVPARLDADSPVVDEAVEEESAEHSISFFEPDSAAEIETADVPLDDVDVTAPGKDQEGVTEILDSDVEAVEPTEARDAAAADVVAELDRDIEEDTDAGGSEESLGDQRRRRGRRRRRSARGLEDERPEEGLEAEERDAAQEDEEEEERDGNTVEEAAGEERERRPRKRRRRRSGRRDSSADDVAAGEVEDQAGSAAEEETEDAASVGEKTGRRKRSGSAQESGSRPKHRKIPTWDEAIKVMVDANLESRSKSSASKGNPRGSRRRGRGSNKRN